MNRYAAPSPRHVLFLGVGLLVLGVLQPLAAEAQVRDCSLFSRNETTPGYTCEFLPDAFVTKANNLNQVAGWRRGVDYPTDQATLHARSFVYADGVFTDIEVPGAAGARATHIDDQGRVLGIANYPNGAGWFVFELFIWSPDSLIRIPYPCHPDAIGDPPDFHVTGFAAGEIVGNVSPPSGLCAWSYRYAGGWVPIDAPNAEAYGLQVGGMNNHGEVVARFQTTSGPGFRGGIVSRDGTWRMLPYIPNLINDRGDIVSVLDERPVYRSTLYRDGIATGTALTLMTRDELDLDVIATAMNNRGDIIGAAPNQPGSGDPGSMPTVGYLYSGGFGSLLPIDGHSGVIGINDRGVITGGRGGNNDINGGFILTPCADQDEDSLCDAWESDGVWVPDPNDGAPVFLDLPAMGADPLRKDVFVQVDYMADDQHNHAFYTHTVAPVIAAFANAPVRNPDNSLGITLHVDCGPWCVMNEATDELWGSHSRAGQVPYSPNLITLVGDVDNWSDFEQIKQGRFPFERHGAFHYAIVAHQITGGEYAGLSRGTPSSDFAVAPKDPTQFNLASTFMHELGHNLGLRHGGGDDVGYKPNYLSIMNYLFTGGLVRDGHQGLLDYSRFVFPPLDESASLNQTLGLQHDTVTDWDETFEMLINPDQYSTFYTCFDAEGEPRNRWPATLAESGGPIDWDCDGNPIGWSDRNTSLTRQDLNPRGHFSTDANGTPGHYPEWTVLTSFNDWKNLRFASGIISRRGAGLILPTEIPNLKEITQDEADELPRLSGVAVSAPDSATGLTGTTLTLSLGVANVGSLADTFSITATATAGWADLTSLPTSTVLPGGSNTSFSIPVHIPTQVQDGAVVTLTVEARSQDNPYARDTRVITITAHRNPAGDWTAPTLSLPENLNIAATGPSGAIVTFGGTALDETDGDRPLTCSPATGSVFPIGTTTVACAATDASGNIGTGHFNITVGDMTPPVTTAEVIPGANASGWHMAPVTVRFSANDDAAGVESVTYAATGAQFGQATILASTAQVEITGQGTTSIAYFARDTAGNTATTQSVDVRLDTAPPLLNLPSDVTAEASGPSGAAVVFFASATDGLSGVASTLVSRASGSVFPLGNTSVSVTARDVAGHEASGSFNVRVQDTQPPSLFVPVSLTVPGTGSSGAAVTFEATAADQVDGPLDVLCFPASGSFFGYGTTTVNCSATDAHGNSASRSFGVVVQNAQPPLLTLPGSSIRQATGPAGAIFTYSASASDALDGILTPTCSLPSGSLLPFGVTTITCTATNSRGASATGSFDITVQDNQPPFLSTPGGTVTREATSPAGAVVTYNVAANDTVDGAVVAACSPASGNLLPFGGTTVTCTATDGHGNSATRTFTIVVQDTQAPFLSLPGAVERQATGPAGAVVAYVSGATDAVDGAIPASCAPASGSTFMLGSTVVQCSATDARGNTRTGSFTVRITDLGPPVLTVPAKIRVMTSDPVGAIATFTTSASDAVQGALEVACVPSSGALFPVGVTPVTCEATDSSGNRSTAAFPVTVFPSVPPVLTGAADFTVEAEGPAGTATHFSVLARDYLDGPLPVSCSPASGSAFPLGRTTVNCSAVDRDGNRATVGFNVKVMDTRPPLLTLPSNLTITSGGSNGAVMPPIVATAVDLVSGPLTVLCSIPTGTRLPIGASAVACKARDASLNTVSGTFTVTVLPLSP